MEATLKNNDEFRHLPRSPLAKSKKEAMSVTRAHIPEWVENTQATSVFNVSKRTLQNWRDRGLLGFSKIGSKIYYSREEINRFLHSHAHQPFNP